MLCYGWQPISPFELGLRAINAAARLPPHPDAAATASAAQQRIAAVKSAFKQHKIAKSIMLIFTGLHYNL
jgi:hypothetical protein